MTPTLLTHLSPEGVKGEEVKTLLEDRLPVSLLSRDAAIEMAFKPRRAYYARFRELGLSPKKKVFDPKIRSIHPWLARRPRSIARALCLAAFLPEDVRDDEFLAMLGFSEEQMARLAEMGYPPLICYARPDRRAISRRMLKREAVVLDPMAGGGTIPLEALNLGMRVKAVEYNPVAYLILKGTLEYPARYGLELSERLREEAKLLIRYASSRLGKFYRPRDEGYIFMMGVPCPSCRRGIVLPRAPHKKLAAFMASSSLEEYMAHGGRETSLLTGTGAFGKRSRRALCPSCGFMMKKEEFFKLWARNHISLLEGGAGDGELLLKTHFLMAKWAKGGFARPDERDAELFTMAFEEYLREKSALPLPSGQIPGQNEVFSRLRDLGLSRWEFLFNPRQALAFGSLLGYLKGRLRELYETEGDFGLAVGLYLAFGFSKLFDFNSLFSSWNYDTNTIRGSLGSYFQTRSFSLRGEYAEAIVPFLTLDWVFEPGVRPGMSTAGGLCPAVEELCKALEGLSGRADVFLGNALEMSSFIGQGSVDVVHVDPPYYDQHIYSDVSELFWQILRTCLHDYLPLLFRDSQLKKWSYSSPEVPREDELIMRKRSMSEADYEEKLVSFLREARRVLRDDGLLIIWFSHRKWKAWRALVKALYEAGFAVTRVYPFASEHPTRLVTRGGKLGFNRILILVARKRPLAKKPLDDALEEELRRALGDIRRARIMPSEEVGAEETAILALATALALITRYRTPEKSFEEMYEEVMWKAINVLRELDVPIDVGRYASSLLFREMKA